MARKKKLKKEEIAEDWCFECKDGGNLRICDYRDCLKVYHPQCVAKDDSFLVVEEKWTCNWHFCSLCSKASKFHCLCCPSGVCKNCLYEAQFALVRRDKGFCDSCLELVLLIELKKNVNSERQERNFNPENMVEGFFKGYWQIVKEEEGLTSEQVISAYNRLKKGEIYRRAFDECGEGIEDIYEFEDGSLSITSDYNDAMDTEESDLPVRSGKRKRSTGKMTGKKEKMPSEDQQKLDEVPIVITDSERAKPFLKCYTRRNEQGTSDGVPESSPRTTSGGNRISCHFPSEQPEPELPDPSVEMAGTRRTEEQNHCLSESSPRSTPEGSGNLNHLPYVQDLSSRLSTSSLVSAQVVTIDVEDETKKVIPLGEGQAFFAEPQSILDKSLENLPRSSQQPEITPDEIHEAKSCFYKCCSMKFEQLMCCAQKEQFLSSLNLLLKCGHFPQKMLEMVTSLQLNFVSNTCLYSNCMESVRKADEKKERNTWLRKEVAKYHSLFLDIQGKIQLANERMEKLRKEMRDNRKLRAGLNEEAKGFVELSRTYKEELSEYIQTYEILEKSKQTGLKIMEEIDASWKKFQMEVLT